MPATELDDLKAAWQSLNRNLERQNALALVEFRERKLSRFRSGLGPLAIGQVMQLVLGAAMTIFFAQFWVSHTAVPPLFVSGLLLQLYGMMFVAFAARDLLLIRRIDYAAPVIVIQRQLAELQAWHLRAAVVHGLTGAVAWLPGMLVLLHFLGADVLMNKPGKMWWLISTALVCLAFNYALVRLARSPGRCGVSLRNSWIGRTVIRARATLDEVEKFEREIK
jgi:hypothetical protein